MSILCFGLLLAALLLPPSVNAEWWEDRTLVEKASISEEQLGQIKKLWNEYREKKIETTSKGKQYFLRLNNLLSEEKLDEKAITEALNQFLQNRSALTQEMALLKIAIHKLFTEAQIKILLTEVPQLFSLQNQWDREGRIPQRTGRKMRKFKEQQ